MAEPDTKSNSKQSEEREKLIDDSEEELGPFKVAIYTTVGCKWCRKAKALLASKNVPVLNINLTESPDRVTEMVELAGGKKTVPQIFFGTKHIGGCSELLELESDGKLDDMLKKAMSADSPGTASPQFIVPGPHIAIFTSHGCKYCKRAKKLLKTKNLKDEVIVEINLDQASHRRDQMVEYSNGKKSVPQIFINGKHVGGSDDIHALEDEGKLNSMLELALITKIPKEFQELYVPVQKKVDCSKSKDKESSSGSDDEAHQAMLKTYREATLKMRSRMYGVKVKTRKYKMTTYKDCFIGKEAVDWLVKNVTTVHSRQEAVEFGTGLMQYQLVHHVCRSQPFRDGHFFYRFQADCKGTVLNMKTVWTKQARSAEEVAEDLRKQIADLFAAHVDDTGRGVDYAAISTSDKFDDYRRAASELQTVNLQSLRPHAKKALFVNLYNALVIHGIVEEGVPDSAVKRNWFFGNISYNIGGNYFSLNDIEHGILRGNKKPPGPFSSRLIGKDDPRAPLVMIVRDARIHFALVCGAKSCPPIRIYTTENVDQALDWAAESFIDDETTVDPNKKEVKLSQLFKWYSSDFGKTNLEVLKFVSKYVTGQKKTDLDKLILNKSFSIKYSTYNWAANKRS